MSCRKWDCLDMGSICCKDCGIKEACNFKCNNTEKVFCRHEVSELPEMNSKSYIEPEAELPAHG